MAFRGEHRVQLNQGILVIDDLIVPSRVDTRILEAAHCAALNLCRYWAGQYRARQKHPDRA